MPRTQYARSGDVNIAYQVIGEGSRDLVYIPGWVSNIDMMWLEPALANFLNQLATFSRLIIFDKRGTGLSDPVDPDGLPGLEVRMDDLRAVMDAAGSERATLFGHSEGGAMSLLFAATYPQRTERLIVMSSYAKRIYSEDYPWAPRWDDRLEEIREIEANWGDPSTVVSLAPSRANDPAFLERMAMYFRSSASPAAAAALLHMNTFNDVTAILPSIRVPTLLLYRVGDQDVKVEEGRYMAAHIPHSRLVELAGADHLFFAGDTEPMLKEIEEFVTGSPRPADINRFLATILFTDIVGSTTRAASMGDAQWTSLLERHHAMVRRELIRWNGIEVNTVGDGFIATFDGPGRAVRSALAIAAAAHDLDIEVTAGLHTGEIEKMGDDIAGLAVHIGARVASLAGPNEVLVSRTVKDLVAGSGLGFEARGRHVLKGVPDEWDIYLAREERIAI